MAHSRDKYPLVFMYSDYSFLSYCSLYFLSTGVLAKDTSTLKIELDVKGCGSRGTSPSR